MFKSHARHLLLLISGDIWLALNFTLVSSLQACFFKTEVNWTSLTFFTTIFPRGGGGGTCQNLDRDARPIFLGLKFGQILFFWVGNFFSYFSGFRKISANFLGLTNFQLFFGSSNFCITHLNPLNEEHTVLKNKIIVAFHIYSNFDNHCILSHSTFFGFEFWGILFFWV